MSHLLIALFMLATGSAADGPSIDKGTLPPSSTAATGGGCSPTATRSNGKYYSCITKPSSGTVKATGWIYRSVAFVASCKVNVNIYRSAIPFSGWTKISGTSYSCPGIFGSKTYSYSKSVGTGKYQYYAFTQMITDGNAQAAHSPSIYFP